MSFLNQMSLLNESPVNKKMANYVRRHPIYLKSHRIGSLNNGGTMGALWIQGRSLSTTDDDWDDGLCKCIIDRAPKQIFFVLKTSNYITITHDP